MTSFSKNHPSTRIKSSDSSLLEGKKIAFGITGSVAAYLSPKIARELMRHGAEIIPIMTKAAQRMIGKDLMWWATGIEPITEVTGDLEHISLAGVMNEPVDLLLIAPCTTNTVAKLAAGNADTPVTLIASSLNGKKIPIMILCVAHEDLINSPPIQEALLKLEDWGVMKIDPVIEEGKAKVPEMNDLLFEIMEKVVENPLSNRKVIVTAGPTQEFIDDVRYISNSSTGRMGIEIAKMAKLNGADVELILGPTQLTVPRIVNTTRITSTDDMVKETLAQLDTNPNSIVILSSAMSDYSPEKTSGKIRSGQNLDISLRPTTKLSDIIKTEFPESTLVLFKAEWDVSQEELAKAAKKKLDHCQGDFIIANDLAKVGAGFATKTNQVLLMKKNGDFEEISDTKFNIALKIISALYTI